MPHLRKALVIAAVGFTSLASATFAETAAAPYDPVAHALALGLTPEAVDAAFDRALSAAESCDTVAIEMQILGCTPRDFAAIERPALPPLES